MKKRILAAWVLTLSMLCTVVLPAQAAKRTNYSDTQGHYAEKAIEIWSGYGVLKGYPDGTFQPNGTVTRAEFAVVLDRIMGYRRIAPNTFTDLSEEQWYTRPILRLVAEGVFTQRAGAMEPDRPITRQETFASLARFFGLAESEKPTGFTDEADISAENRGYIAAMREVGYIQGDGNGTIRPNDSLTRAELVTMLSRMIAGLVNAKGTYSQNCPGTMVVNEGEVTLKNMTIDGDLIVGDGAANSDVYLNGVTVKGEVVLRGCGVNSFHIGADSQVNKIIVNKPAEGGIRVVNETDRTIPLVEVKEAADGVILVGELQTVEVTSGTEVTLKGNVNKLSVTASDAEINVDEEAKVVSLVTDAAARVNNKGKISSVKVQADGLVLDGNAPGTVTTVKGVVAPVDAKGNKVVASGSSGSSSSRGSSSGGSSGSGSSSGGSSSGGSSALDPVETTGPDPKPAEPSEPISTPAADCKHTRVELVEEACVPATCTQTGLSVTRCRDCGEMIEEVIDPRNHQYGTWNNPNPSEGDWQVWTATCTVCGQEGFAEVMTGTDPNRVTISDDFVGHIPGVGDPQPQGCKIHLMEMVGDYEYGDHCTSRSWTEVCKICGAVSQPTEMVHGIFAGWHIWEVITPQVDPTCTENGVMAVQRCKRCGSEISTDYTGSNTIPALGHDYVNGVCTRCGAKETEEDLPDEGPALAETPFDQPRSTDPGLALLLAMATAVLLLYGAEYLRRKRQN